MGANCCRFHAFQHLLPRAKWDADPVRDDVLEHARQALGEPHQGTRCGRVSSRKISSPSRTVAQGVVIHE
ncbi:MAG: hypothetical protein EOO70_00670 [Myxococcaceae bacterium]|nr:MAG: hypothetical protein EOO70_00670 [Myxococcaceae bacterium]